MLKCAAMADRRMTCKHDSQRTKPEQQASQQNFMALLGREFDLGVG
jgi:hypothetical protein